MTESPPNRPGKILVMDDDSMLLSTARMMLQRLGFDVLLAGDGDEAANLYAEHYQTDYPVDVAILDMRVEGGAGALESAQAILATDPSACLVIASGSTNHDTMLNHADHGFAASITKPFVMADLGLVLGELLD
jgi:DNA-binding NtrC family response regulator